MVEILDNNLVGSSHGEGDVDWQVGFDSFSKIIKQWSLLRFREEIRYVQKIVFLFFVVPLVTMWQA
jgi:hypothetical protein